MINPENCHNIWNFNSNYLHMTIKAETEMREGCRKTNITFKKINKFHTTKLTPYCHYIL